MSDLNKNKHKAGFVNIVGKPNVGKSTLMNALVGEQLSIITFKAQTTRQRIMGIVNEADFQIVYSDTPGMVDNPGYKMHDAMNRFVQGALSDADVVLLMIDATDKKDDYELYIQRLSKVTAPIVLVINKCDAVSEAVADKKLQNWTTHIKPLIGYKISALKGSQLPEMLAKIVELLPFHPPYYDKDQLTDRPMRFFVSEIIREKIMLNYGEEIPYSVEVEIEEYQEEEKIDRIRALIVTNRESQKPILIGKGGAMLKKVGSEARIDLEKFLEKKVFLELFVKVRENWRNDERFLRYKGFDV